VQGVALTKSLRFKVQVPKELEGIMPTFLANREKDITIFGESLEQDKFDTIKVIGHKLAGNAGSYGLPDLGAIGVKIEESASKGNKTALTELLAEYKAYMEALEVSFI
jgi:HPt (histidine-containing phosphotransfer) domain-containing protein